MSMTTPTEETIKRFEEVFGENGRFGRATEVLATTFTGTLSMINDKIFQLSDKDIINMIKNDK